MSELRRTYPAITLQEQKCLSKRHEPEADPEIVEELRWATQSERFSVCRHCGNVYYQGKA